MWAPLFLPGRRAISVASSPLFGGDEILGKRAEPITLVRSPTMRGRVLSSASIISMAGVDGGDVFLFGWGGAAVFSFGPFVRFARMCSSVVPQQPPTILKPARDRPKRFELFLRAK